MGHKADRGFFVAKKPWSKRKDRILRYYLTPYLPKIATVRRPILVVDAFAGPGRFDDGETGSPLILATSVQSFLSTHASVDCRLLCIERDPQLHARLSSNLEAFPFARTRQASFLDCIPEIEQAARSSSVFIYADPFAIAGLEWDAMDRVFRFIDARQSIELLLNFNAPAFVRRARAALHYVEAQGDPGDDDDASGDMASHALDRVVGGDWWRATAKPIGSFPIEVAGIAEKLRQQLAARFGEAGIYPVRERLGASVPKYYLVFASRHRDGLVLINEAVCSDRESEVAKVVTSQRLLFESSPEELPSVDGVLRPQLLVELSDGMSRRELQVAATRALFGQFREKAIRDEIKRLRKQGWLRAEPDTPSLNDASRLFRAQR